MGIIDRGLADMDAPSQSFGMPVNAGGSSLMLVSDCKYGYRGTAEGLSLTLVRSSVDPDPWPEIGEHHIRMAIALSSRVKSEAAAIARAFCTRMVVASTRAHKGSMPAVQSLMQFSGAGLILSCVKKAEDGNGLILRYYEVEGNAGRGTVKMMKPPKGAMAVSLLEQPVEGHAAVDGDTVHFDYRAYGVGNLRIQF
jgi:alpha-mannosidase